MDNIVVSLYAKFDHDRLRNAKVLVPWKSDNNNPNNKNNIHSDWWPVK